MRNFIATEKHEKILAEFLKQNLGWLIVEFEDTGKIVMDDIHSLQDAKDIQQLNPGSIISYYSFDVECEWRRPGGFVR